MNNNDINWLSVDSSHIVQPTVELAFRCPNCDKEYLYVRDRCPFCHCVIDSFNHNGLFYIIKDGNIYTKSNGELYVYSPSQNEMVPVDENRPTSTSIFPGFGSIIETTIVVFILLFIFVLIVAFLDETVFHDA